MIRIVSPPTVEIPLYAMIGQIASLSVTERPSMQVRRGRAVFSLIRSARGDILYDVPKTKSFSPPRYEQFVKLGIS